MMPSGCWNAAASRRIGRFFSRRRFRPHTPYVSPKKYFELYDEKEMRVVQGVKEDQADIPPAGLGSYKKEQDKLTDDLRRQCLQAYLASISFMDNQVGKPCRPWRRTASPTTPSSFSPAIMDTTRASTDSGSKACSRKVPRSAADRRTESCEEGD